MTWGVAQRSAVAGVGVGVGVGGTLAATMNEEAGDGVGVGLPVVSAICACCGEGWARAAPARTRGVRARDSSMAAAAAAAAGQSTAQEMQEWQECKSERKRGARARVRAGDEWQRWGDGSAQRAAGRLLSALSSACATREPAAWRSGQRAAQASRPCRLHERVSVSGRHAICHRVRRAPRGEGGGVTAPARAPAAHGGMCATSARMRVWAPGPWAMGHGTRYGPVRLCA